MLNQRNVVLSPKQQKTLDLIKEFRARNKVSPTVKELGEALNLKSLRSVTQRLESLEKKGFIKRDRFRHRGITILNETNPFSNSGLVQIPVVASAGCDAMEVFAQETFNEYLSVDRSLIPQKMDVVAIKAVGSSMVDAGIHNGDYVLTEVTHNVQSGDRVVAVIDGMAVIKRLQIVPNAVILNPEAKDMGYSPIVMKGDFQVFGKVLSVIKTSDKDDVQFIYDKENY